MGADSSQRQRRHAKKLERLRRRQTERRKSHGTEAESHGPPLVLDFRDTSPGVRPRPKLSMILLELLERYLPPGERSLREMRTGIAFAAAAWNATVQEQRGRDDWPLLVESIRSSRGKDPQRILDILGAMREQKLDRYASDLRTVVNWAVTECGDAFDVQVVSANPEEDAPIGRMREA